MRRICRRNLGHSRGLQIHHVDNSWAYVTVERNDIEDFMVEILKGKTNPGPNVLAGRSYLLMAEEF